LFAISDSLAAHVENFIMPSTAAAYSAENRKYGDIRVQTHVRIELRSTATRSQIQRASCSKRHAPRT
jgi:hypothetical protein